MPPVNGPPVNGPPVSRPPAAGPSGARTAGAGAAAGALSSRELVIEVLRRLGEADFDGTAELLADDFVQEYPYLPMPGAASRIVGISDFLDFVRPGMSAFAPYRYRVSAIYETTDPAVVLAEYSSHSHVLTNGEPYSNRYMGVFRFDSARKLALWREYLNPDVIADILAKMGP